jgi:coiled-coil-helix-coiled-coil-helix domain-containing protein 2
MPEQQHAYEQNSTDAYAQPMDQGLYNSQSSYAQQAQGPCAADTAKFTQCFDKTGGDMTACGFYLEQLKACQQAARNYS